MAHGLHVSAFMADGREYPIPRCFDFYRFSVFGYGARLYTTSEPRSALYSRSQPAYQSVQIVRPQKCCEKEGH